MLAAAFERHLDRTLARSIALRESTPTDRPGALDRDSLAKGLSGFLESRVRQDRDRYMASFEIQLELARDAALRERLAESTADSNALAVEMIAEIGGRQPGEDAQLITAMLQGLTLQWLAAGEDSDFGERVEPPMRRFAEMLTTPP